MVNTKRKVLPIRCDTVCPENTSANDVPVISIGLPVYNGENFLEQAIESVLAQTFQDYELVISDNASTDATQAFASAMRHKMGEFITIEATSTTAQPGTTTAYSGSQEATTSNGLLMTMCLNQRFLKKR